MDGASAMRQSTPNPQLQAQADVQMRESRRNIEYLDGILKDLQMRQGMDNMSFADRNSGGGRHGGYTGQQQSQYHPYGPDHVRAGSGEVPDYGHGGYSDPRNATPGPPRAPFGPPGPGGHVKAKPNYSKLGTTRGGSTITDCDTDCKYRRLDQRQYTTSRSSNTAHALAVAIQAQRRRAV